MQVFDSSTNYTDYFNITVTGPGEPYVFTILYGFADSTTFHINFTIESITYGNKKDKFVIDFDQQLFISQKNATLYNSQLEGSLYKVPIMPDVVEAIGTTADAAMSSTLTIMIASNVMMGQSSELMWSFFNTIQILYFFPVLGTYFPDHLYQFFTYFSSSKIRFSIDQVKSLESNVKSELELEEKINMPAKDLKWEDIGYESTSILINGDELIMLMVQGTMMCILVFALKALLFTTVININDYQNEIDKLEQIEANREEEVKEDIKTQDDFESQQEYEQYVADNKQKRRIRKWVKKRSDN